MNILTPTQLAAMTGRSRRQVLRWAELGSPHWRIPRSRGCNRVVFVWEAIMQWVERNRWWIGAAAPANVGGR